MLPSLQYFLFGCLGAIAPEILRLYRLRNNIKKFSWSWGYALVSLLFVVLGGSIALILEPRNAYTAFYSGVSTPFIINAIAREAEEASGTEAISVTQDKIATGKSADIESNTVQARGGEKRLSSDTMIATPRGAAEPELPESDLGKEKEIFKRERRRNLGRFFHGL